jgi:sugar lactone lactonase YvrE
MTEPAILLDGVAMGESPRWHDGRLWFADWAAHEIVAVDPAGRRETVATMPSLPFSIDWLPDGRLVVITGREGELLVHDANGSWRTLVDLSGLSTKPWNEIVIDGRGNTYLNDIGFDFPGGQFAPGFIALVTPDGVARTVAEGLAFPNGMAVSADNRTLIVGESYGNCLTAFNIGSDGSLSHRRVWAHVGDDHPDGICLDQEGAAWYADVGTSRCVRVREGGEQLAEVQLDRGCFACALGGRERRTLYMVAADYSDPRALMSGQTRTGRIYALDVSSPGAGWP